MNDVFWKTKFPEVYQSVQALPEAQARDPQEWTQLAIESSLLSSEDYLPVAQNYYSLAVLNDRFFTEQFTTLVYEKYKSEFNWSSTAVPFAEWDGVVFVACLDPHQVPSNLETVYRPILASYEGLTWAWNRLHQQQTDLEETKFAETERTSPAPKTPPPPPPAADSLATFTPPPTVSSGIQSTQNLFELVDTPSEATSEEELLSSEPQPEAEFEMPEGLSFGLAPAPSTPPPPPPQAPPAPPKRQVAPPPSPRNDLRDFERTAAQQLNIKINPDQAIEEELMLCFAKAFQNYRNLMILKVHGDQAIPFRWDPSYRPPKSVEPVNLSKPSVFRIVSKTQKPFHGPVVLNDTNKAFFAAWFGGLQPGFLTIIPLFFDGEMAGMILAAADQMPDSKGSLNLMQTTAQKVESTFGARIAV
jgi:hypothetical protein